VFILGIAISGTILLTDAINNTVLLLNRRLQPLISIQFNQSDFENYLDNNFEWDDEELFNQEFMRPNITSFEIEEIGDLEAVYFYNYILGTRLYSFEFDRYISKYHAPNWGVVHEEAPMDFIARGTNSTRMVQFQQESINLVSGRQFEEHEMIQESKRIPAIVSEKFAIENNLHLSSDFELYQIVLLPNDANVSGRNQWWLDQSNYEKVEITFEIIGLFDVPVPASEGMWDDLWQEMYTLNTIYMPNWAVEIYTTRAREIMISNWSSIEDGIPIWIRNEETTISLFPDLFSLFILKNPQNINEFKELAEPLLPEFHEFEDLAYTIAPLSRAMVSMQNISNWILFASIASVILILSLLITLFLHDRRYEIGVYLTLGEKRIKIIMQVLLEVVISSLFSITLALIVGNVISSTLVQNLLTNQFLAEVTTEGNFVRRTVFDEIGISVEEISAEEMIDAFEISLGFETISLFYIIGLGTVVLSTLTPVLYIVRLKPKKVLL